ncbi:MAG: AraC family transcriptional regulator [Reichenbachiella sp.]
MILEHKKLDLFGKMLFETMVLMPPFQKPNPMPDEACFLYVMEGAYDSTSEQEQLRIQADESVLMKCGNYLSDMVATPPTDQYQAVAVHFYPDVLMKIYEDKLPDFLTKTEVPNTGMAKLNSDVLIKKYIDGLLFYFENPQIVDEEILILKLKEIIVLLNKTKNAPAIRVILSNLFNPTSYSLREIVDAHLYSIITIERMADLAGMSVSTFKREFQKVYTESPATYIRTKKIDKALELLSATDMRTTEIAYECGFSSVSHFSRTFKQLKGIPPTVYKLNH